MADSLNPTKEQHMAKKASAGGEGHNSFDPKNVPQYVRRVEEVQAQIDDIMAAARDEAAPLREDIAAIKKEAHDTHSIPRMELNVAIAQRRDWRRAEARRTRLSGPQQDNLDSIQHELGGFGDTPLGAAAAAKAAEGRAATH
jgi:hypothetical protein